jgi:hypothetical protein
MEKEENARQLKLRDREEEGKVVKKKKKDKKNKVQDRWVVFWVLLVTVFLSLGFYLVSLKKAGFEGQMSVSSEKKNGVEKRDSARDVKKSGGLFGPAVHEF